jgi:hypothetical protein
MLVVPVVQAGKVEIQLNCFDLKVLGHCPFFQNRAVQFRTFGKLDFDLVGRYLLSHDSHRLVDLLCGKATDCV